MWQQQGPTVAQLASHLPCRDSPHPLTDTPSPSRLWTPVTPEDLQRPQPMMGSHRVRSESCPLLGVLGQVTGLLWFPAAKTSALRCRARPAGAAGTLDRGFLQPSLPPLPLVSPASSLPVRPRLGPPLLEIITSTPATQGLLCVGAELRVKHLTQTIHVILHYL